jgi:nucleoside-diphosphate kinase
MERTFAIIKPDAVAARYTGRIIQRIEKQDSPFVPCAHAPHAAGGRGVLRRPPARPFFGSLTDVHVVRAPASCMALEAPDAIKKWRRLMGATDPGQGRRRHAAQGLRRLDREQRDARLRRARDRAFELGYFFRGMELR